MNDNSIIPNDTFTSAHISGRFEGFRLDFYINGPNYYEHALALVLRLIADGFTPLDEYGGKVAANGT
jgi:hypothetical protein